MKHRYAATQPDGRVTNNTFTACEPCRPAVKRDLIDGWTLTRLKQTKPDETCFYCNDVTPGTAYYGEMYSLLLTIPGKGTQPFAQAYTTLRDARRAANVKTKDMGASCIIEVVDLDHVLHSTHALGRSYWKLEAAAS